jgi:putative membrane protein
MRRLAWLGLPAGAVLLAALLAFEGWSGILAAFAQAGWLLLLVLPARVVTLALDARAWRVLLAPFDPSHAATPLFLLWVAFVREAVNRLLPVANIGGEIVGVRLARIRVHDTSGVAASVVVEVLLTIAVLYLFCGAGVLLMLRLVDGAGAGQVTVIAATVLLSLPGPGLTWWLLRHGTPFQRLERWAMRRFGSAAAQLPGLDGTRLDADVGRLLRQHGRLGRALCWAMLAYLLGSFETWLPLYLIGHPVSLQAAVAIEALSQATRHANFLVPAGLGVQEAAVLLFGHLAGVGGDAALMLALVKRLREVATGLPALLSWQWFELRRASP